MASKKELSEVQKNAKAFAEARKLTSWGGKEHAEWLLLLVKERAAKAQCEIPGSVLASLYADLSKGGGMNPRQMAQVVGIRGDGGGVRNPFAGASTSIS